MLHILLTANNDVEAIELGVCYLILSLVRWNHIRYRNEKAHFFSTTFSSFHNISRYGDSEFLRIDRFSDCMKNTWINAICVINKQYVYTYTVIKIPRMEYEKKNVFVVYSFRMQLAGIIIKPSKCLFILFNRTFWERWASIIFVLF